MVGAPVWAMGGRKRKAETEEGQVRSGQQSRIGDLVTLVVVETLKRQHMHAVSRRSCGALETSRTTSVLGYCIHTIQCTSWRDNKMSTLMALYLLLLLAIPYSF